MECAFKAEGLITEADGKNTVNLAALNTRLTSYAVGAWEPVVNAAKANCTATPPKVEGDQTCTSGAKEVSKCLIKHFMKGCPAPTNSTECNERKNRMDKWEGKMDELRKKFGG